MSGMIDWMLLFRRAPLQHQNINRKSALIFLLQLADHLFLQPQVLIYAEVAHLVEHDLAKVGVAGSSPVFRSESPPQAEDFFWMPWW